MNGVLISAPARRQKQYRRPAPRQPQPLPEWAQFAAVLLLVLQFCSQITSLQAVTGSAPNRTTTYTYDTANNRSSKAVATSSGTATTAYTYNNLNQLTLAVYDDNYATFSLGYTTSQTYTYDLNGNRYQKTTSLTLAGMPYTIGPETCTYDFENRLIKYVNSGNIYNYAYDYRTRRILRDESSTGLASTTLVYSGGTSVQEYDNGSSTPSVEYVRGSDYGGGVGGILYTIRSGANSYTHANRRGDIIARTDASGALTYQAQYEGFGNQSAMTGTTSERQKSNSKDTDPTGLVDEGMRYRDLATGVFITKDPAGFVDGPNVYTYVKQNPWTSFDPEGLDTYQQYSQDQGQQQSNLDTYTSKHPIEYINGRSGKHEKYDSQRQAYRDAIRKDQAGMDRINDLVNDFNKINAGPAGNLNGNTQITVSQRDQIDDNYSIQYLFLEAHRHLALTAGEAVESAVMMAGGELIGAGTKAIMALRAVAPAAEETAALTNPVPTRFARVVPAEFANGTYLGAPTAQEAWVTGASDLEGITTSEGLAQRLTLVDESGNLITGPRAVIEFDGPVNGLASPINRTAPGFVGGGQTAGGAREFVMPNTKISDLPNVTIRYVH